MMREWVDNNSTVIMWLFYGTFSGVSYSADFVSFATLVHLLWPSHKTKYFNLKLEKNCEEQPKINDGIQKN